MYSTLHTLFLMGEFFKIRVRELNSLCFLLPEIL